MTVEQTPNNNHKSMAALSRHSLFSRRTQDRFVQKFFALLTLLPLLLIIFILALLIQRSLPIFQQNGFWNVILGQEWKPLKGLFGFYPFIMGTLWVTFLAVLLAVPPCLLLAIYLSEYAGKTLRAFFKPVLDILAAVPSVVYGVWGMLVIVPWVNDSLRPLLARWLGDCAFIHSDNPTGFSVLAGMIVLAVMIAPFIISVVCEIMLTVPEGLKQASLGLGATRWQMVKHVVIPQTFSGIIAGIMLGTSRALGETMAVMMVVGNVAIVPSSIFDPAYPLPALIANNYGEMMSIPLYDSALMGASLILLVIVLFFNIVSNRVVRQIKRRIRA